MVGSAGAVSPACPPRRSPRVVLVLPDRGRVPRVRVVDERRATCASARGARQRSECTSVTAGLKARREGVGRGRRPALFGRFVTRSSLRARAGLVRSVTLRSAAGAG